MVYTGEDKQELGGGSFSKKTPLSLLYYSILFIESHLKCTFNLKSRRHCSFALGTTDSALKTSKNFTIYSDQKQQKSFFFPLNFSITKTYQEHSNDQIDDTSSQQPTVFPVSFRYQVVILYFITIAKSVRKCKS